MIICVCGNFPVYDRHGHSTGKKEFSVSHGVDYHTGENVILSGGHPQTLGAVYSRTLSEWVLLDKGESLNDYGME